MAIINKDGMSVSYECSDLIAELEQDIFEFGDDLEINAIIEKRYKVDIIIDYCFPEEDFSYNDFDDEDDEYIPPPKLKNGERFVKMKAVDALAIMRQQNSIF